MAAQVTQPTAAPAPTSAKAPAKAPGKAPGKAPAPTDPLAPLSSKQITGQATKTIGLAYAPAYQDLNQQGRTAQGLSDKRSADNKYYQTWLDTQSAALQAHADDAHKQLQGLEGGLLQNQSTLYGGQAQGLEADANARAGNVSNNAQSNAFGTNLKSNQQYNQGLLMNASQQVNSGMATQTDQLGAARANNYNVIQNANTKQLTDLNTTLTNISNARNKLNTSKTADIAKEIARLQGIEIQKAQSNRDFAAASQKLGIAAANTQSLITTRAGTLAVAKQNAATALTRAQSAQMNADRTYSLNVAKYNAATAKDIYERDHGLGPYKVAAGHVAKPLSQASQNVVYSHIDKTKSLIENLINNHGLTPQQAYHLVQHGGSYPSYPTTNPTTGAKTVHYATISANPYGDQILNAAYNARTGGPGLSPGDLAALKKLGLASPDKRYGSYNTSISPGGAASPH